MQKLSMKLIISLIIIAALWFNYSRHDEVWHDSWRSDNLTGYAFQEAPEYFTHLEERKIAVLVFQEALILVSGLLLLKGIEKGKE